MSNVPFKNTKYRNNFIGKDRPIYGNEYIQSGGYYPAGKCFSLDLGISGEYTTLYEIEFYSGGTLDSVYFSGNSQSAAQLSSFDNYVINQPLGGVKYKAYKGRNSVGGDIYLFYVEDQAGYRYIASGSLYPYFDPIYSSEFNTSPLFLSYPLGLAPADVIEGIGYPPEGSLYSPPLSFIFGDVRFNTPCIGGFTPTPTPTPGVFIPTPTPTPSITATQTTTPTPSPTFVCSCTSYSVVNNGGTSGSTTYIDCNYLAQSVGLDAGQGISFCGCFNTISVSNKNMTITNLGECVPPTPSPTPTFTPTPSSTQPDLTP